MEKTNTRAATSKIAPFGLRLQPELKARLEEAATDNGRSLNAEITARLQESFEPSRQREPIVYVTSRADIPKGAQDLGEVIARLEKVTETLRAKMPQTDD